MVSEELFEAIADGVSAVRTARYRGHTEIVDAMVAAGAALDVFDAADLAVERQHPGLADRLRAVIP